MNPKTIKDFLFALPGDMKARDVQAVLRVIKALHRPSSKDAVCVLIKALTRWRLSEATEFYHSLKDQRI